MYGLRVNIQLVPALVLFATLLADEPQALVLDLDVLLEQAPHSGHMVTLTARVGQAHVLGLCVLPQIMLGVELLITKTAAVLVPVFGR